jgi:TonB family protein
MISAMSVEAIPRDWVGRVIDGRFTLLQWLGGSQRSSVFLTELPSPQARKAAIKLIPDDGLEAEVRIAGWAAATPLSHPHLMPLIHTGRCESEGTALLYSVSEYADEVLSEILPERALTPSEASEMLAPVIDALSYLHGNGLVHGHLKPSNILVVDDRLKISGDSLQVASETGKPAAALTIYDAPERAKGIISPDGDLWSLGVTLVESLTQHPPAWDTSIDEDPVVPESIPQPLAGIARGCLRADPMGRCNLDNVKTWLEAEQPSNGASGTTGKKAPAKFGVTALVAAVIVLAAVVVLVEMHSNKTQASAPVQTDAQQQAQDQAAAEAPAPEQKPSPSVAYATPTSAPQAPASESHASKPVTINDQAAKAAVAEQVMPDILPAASQSIHGEFKVRIRVTVDGAGNVTDAKYDSEGPSHYFAKAALQAAQKWKFKPGQAASNAWILEFHFTPSGTDVAPTAVH